MKKTKVKESTSLSFRIIALMMLITLCCGLLCGCSEDGSLSEKEEYAVGLLQNYKKMMKFPESMTLVGSVAYVELENGTKYVFFESKGENSYGMNVKSVEIYKDGKYYMDLDSLSEKGHSNDYSTSLYEAGQASRQRVLYLGEVAMIKSILLYNREMGEDRLPDDEIDGSKVTVYEELDGKKIADEIKCKYTAQ